MIGKWERNFPDSKSLNMFPWKRLKAEVFQKGKYWKVVKRMIETLLVVLQLQTKRKFKVLKTVAALTYMLGIYWYICSHKYMILYDYICVSVCTCILPFTNRSFHLWCDPFDTQGAGSSQPILEKWLPQRIGNRWTSVFSAGLHELYRSEQLPSGKLRGRNGISCSPKLLLTQASSAICRHAANVLQPQCPTNCR